MLPESRGHPCTSRRNHRGGEETAAKGTAWTQLEPEPCLEKPWKLRECRLQTQRLPEPSATHQARDCWALPDLCNFCQESYRCL